MGAERANISLDGAVAVFAEGPIGLMATVDARLLGVGLIIVVESMPGRQQPAKQFGADVVADYTKRDPVEEILRLTGNQGVDSAIECLGAQVTFETCVKATRPGGTISVAGYYGDGDYVKIPRLTWGMSLSDRIIKSFIGFHG